MSFKYRNEGLNEPDMRTIAADIGISLFDVSMALDAISDPISLYEPAYFDGEDSELVMDQIADKNKEDIIIENLDLQSAIDALPQREQEVIKLRFFEGKTQTEVSKCCNVSQAQVSRIENCALKKLEAALR